MERKKYIEFSPERKRNADKAAADYRKNNYYRVNINIPLAKKDAIKAAAEAVGESMNVYILKAIEQRMDTMLLP